MLPRMREYGWEEGARQAASIYASQTDRGSIAISIRIFPYKLPHGTPVPTHPDLAAAASPAPHPKLSHWVDPAASAAPPRELATADTTAQVHPGSFTKAVLTASDAEVVIGEVKRVVVRDGRVIGVEVKGRGVVDADAVVLALGPWSGGEVYICGITKDEEVPNDPATITGDPDSIAALHEIAGRVSSQLKREEGAEVVAEQACYMPCTSDELPVIGEMPGVKGCYVATGHGGWGILNAPATGAALAELILNGSASIVDLSPFSPARFLNKRTRFSLTSAKLPDAMFCLNVNRLEQEDAILPQDLLQDKVVAFNKVQGYFALFDYLIQFLLVEFIETLDFLNIRAPISVKEKRKRHRIFI
uniref:FAD dependent oxidoreductase domain-containing protein n=1 Tax=Oryza barthii TaxID=65489 RepID=A0A0D3EQS8_9ORYZ